MGRQAGFAVVGFAVGLLIGFLLFDLVPAIILGVAAGAFGYWVGRPRSSPRP